MTKHWMVVLAAGAMALGACGNDDDDTGNGPEVIRGFTFEITIEPEDFAPASVESLEVAFTGDPASNPADTVQLYTPNDTLTWQSGTDVDYFSFDVELTNFYNRAHCHMRVIVDEIVPEDDRFFVHDDRGTEYADGVTGAGVWAYGDLQPQERETRRWSVGLTSREAFQLKGRVVADDSACDTYAR